MRNISFQLTTDQIRARSKFVTRRLGWKMLKPGDMLQGCVKCMGLKPGEKIERLAVIRVLSVRREPLNSLTNGTYTARMAKREVIAEGFPEMSARQFVEMFCEHMGCTPGKNIRRIQFDYVELRRAIMTATVDGKFTFWKKGSIVLAKHISKDTCSIERMKWKGALPLMNCCCGVPLDVVKFLE